VELAKFGYWSELKVEKQSLKKQLEISVPLLLSLSLSLSFSFSLTQQNQRHFWIVECF
jgi:hypothetical protein